MASLLWKAVATHHSTTLAKYNQPDTISFHVEFLLPVTLGDVTISIQDVRLGKVSSTVNVTMTQGGKQRMGAYFTYVSMLLRQLGFEIVNVLQQCQSIHSKRYL